MASDAQKISLAVPAIAGAAWHAAWAASKVGAVALASLFTILNLAYGAYGIVEGHMKILELPGVVLGGAVILALSLLFSLVITVPTSAAMALASYPFLRRLKAADARMFGLVGFLVGVLIWLGIWSNGSAGNIYFGSPWVSPFLVGGLAGCAGGLAFARHLPREP